MQQNYYITSYRAIRLRSQTALKNAQMTTTQNGGTDLYETVNLLYRTSKKQGNSHQITENKQQNRKKLREKAHQPALMSL